MFYIHHPHVAWRKVSPFLPLKVIYATRSAVGELSTLAIVSWRPSRTWNFRASHIQFCPKVFAYLSHETSFQGSLREGSLVELVFKHSSQRTRHLVGSTRFPLQQARWEVFVFQTNKGRRRRRSLAWIFKTRFPGWNYRWRYSL